MMIYSTTLLLSVAWALLIFNEKQVYSGVIVVSSYTSEFGTFCNGLRCPSGSGCMVSSNVINGNRTSDTRCSNINGEVVRREIITVSNGEMCIKNFTLTGGKVNMEQSCRNMSKADTDYMEQRQNAFKVSMVLRSKPFEEHRQELESRIKKKTEKLEMRARALERAGKARAERLKARLAKMERNLKARFG